MQATSPPERRVLRVHRPRPFPAASREYRCKTKPAFACPQAPPCRRAAGRTRRFFDISVCQTGGYVLQKDFPEPQHLGMTWSYLIRPLCLTACGPRLTRYPEKNSLKRLVSRSIDERFAQRQCDTGLCRRSDGGSPFPSCWMRSVDRRKRRVCCPSLPSSSPLKRPSKAAMVRAASAPPS
jgi:hypothetical protein